MPTQTSDPPELPGLTYVRRLGTGGYAEVFLYEQLSPRMRVAVKVLFAESLSQRTLDQFAAEANTMAELADHPNIVQIFRSDLTDDGRPYLVMKYYPQRNMAVRARTERFAVPEVLEIGVRVACAVETAHRAGILHRDIKPANILTSQYGEPGLTDFGIATTGVEQDVDTEGLSIPWSPPEVVFSKSPGDRSSDIYSLGATLWHLLVGHSPFEEPGGDNTSFAFVRRIREMPPPRTGRDDVPPSLERLLAQTMAKSPLDRPQSALQLARSLQAIETEQRWSPTPLVLLETESTDVDGDEHEDPEETGSTEGRSSATRSRPQVVGPKEPPSSAEADDEPETRHRLATVSPSGVAPKPTVGTSTGRQQRSRQGMPEEADDLLTIQRSTAKSQERERSDEAVEEVDPNPRKRLAVGLVAVAVVIVGVSVGVVLLHNGSPGGSTDTTTTAGSSTAPTIATVESPNAPTGLAGTRVSPAEVQFTWTIPGQQSSDKVWWVDSGDTTQTDVRHFVTSNVANVPSATTVCIQVFVQAGTASAAQSDPKCAG